MLNYELAGGNHLLVQVTMKLVDPQSGKVLGRARDWANPELGSVENLFADDGRKIKEVFAKATKPLVAADLQAIGLLRD